MSSLDDDRTWEHRWVVVASRGRPRHSSHLVQVGPDPSLSWRLSPHIADLEHAGLRANVELVRLLVDAQVDAVLEARFQLCQSASPDRHVVDALAELRKLSAVVLASVASERREAVGSDLESGDQRARVLDEPRQDRVVVGQALDAIAVLDGILECPHLGPNAPDGPLHRTIGLVVADGRLLRDDLAVELPNELVLDIQDGRLLVTLQDDLAVAQSANITEESTDRVRVGRSLAWDQVAERSFGLGVLDHENRKCSILLAHSSPHERIVNADRGHAMLSPLCHSCKMRILFSTPSDAVPAPGTSRKMSHAV